VRQEFAAQRGSTVAMKLLSVETSVKTTVAICLSLIAGYLDGDRFLVLGTHVSFMSGNTTFSGLEIGQGHFDTDRRALVKQVTAGASASEQ
jgi:uncharacterized membrane protein YoaK (UPF0700 family)